MKLNLRRHMRFINPWMFFLRPGFGLFVNKKEGRICMGIRGSVFEFSHGKTHPIQLFFDAAIKTA